MNPNGANFSELASHETPPVGDVIDDHVHNANSGGECSSIMEDHDTRPRNLVMSEALRDRLLQCALDKIMEMF